MFPENIIISDSAKHFWIWNQSEIIFKHYKRIKKSNCRIYNMGISKLSFCIQLSKNLNNACQIYHQGLEFNVITSTDKPTNLTRE